MTSHFEDIQNVTLPLNMYVLGLMVVSHNRPVGTDDLDICFSKPTNSKLKQQGNQGLCYECGIQATIKCPQCNALYCFVCYSKIHGRALQNHSKIVLSEGNNDSAFIVRNTCSERCKEPLGYYCEHCEIAGCSHCMLRLHKKHNYLPLSSKNQQLLPDFHNVQQRVTESLQRVRQAGKKLKTTALYPTQTQNADTVETAITQHFAYLHGVLQTVERKILETLHRQRNSRNKNIDEISELIKELEERLHSALLVTTSVEENLDKVDLQQVIRKLEELADIPCHLVVNSVRNDQEIRFNVDDSIVEALQKHCNVQIPAVSSFSLQRTELLPDDYEMEPLTEEINIPRFCSNSSMRMKSESTDSLHSRKNDNLPAVGCSEMVRITHVVDPSWFYVQLMQNQNKITELSKGLSSMANTWGITPTDVTLNGLYVVQSSKDRLWYRGRITEKRVDVKGDVKYCVLLVDYGTEEANVPVTRMRNIVPQFAMMPILAIRCTLFDIVPNDGKWHPDAILAFKKLVCTNAMVSMSIMMITGDTYCVELCVISAQDSRLISVKDSLTYMKYATCVCPNKLMRTNPDSTRQYYKEQLDIECYTEVQILSVESPNVIYVQKKHANRSYFCTMVREMTDHYEHNTSATELIPVPCKDLPCAAPGTDRRWHRGLVSEVTENTVKVFYVDLGYSLTLSCDSIRSLSRKYMGCRTQAIKVSLKNIKPNNPKKQWGDETNEFLKKFLMSTKNFKIVAFEKFLDTYSVAMYTYDRSSVVHLLLKNNLAVNAGSSFYNKDGNLKRQKKNKPKKNVVAAMPPQSPYNEPDISTIIEKSVKKKSVLDDAEDPFKVCVVIHHAESPDCIYVSDATCEQRDIDQMTAQLQEFYSKYRSAKREVWTKDTVCAVFSSKTYMYYRGRIIDIKSPDKVRVFLYDVGLEDTVTLNDIQSLYPPFFKVPTYVFKIKLTGILPCGGSMSWPSLSCEELRGIINTNHYCKFYISKLEDEDVEDSAIPVELWIKQSKMDGPLTPTRIEINSVSRMLVEKGVALPIKEYAQKRDKILAIELKRQMIKKLERLTKSETNVKWQKIDNELDESIESIDKEASKAFLRYSDSESDGEGYSSEEILDNIPSLPKLSAWLPADLIAKDSFIAIPTYLDHNGYLYLHSKEQNLAELRKIELKLEKLYKNCTIESCDTVWAAGDLCIAQYHANKKWYRGTVIKVQENELFNVEFVDYGNVEECTIGNLKKEVVLENIPIQCTKCIIYSLIPGYNNGQWRIDDLDKIHSLLIEQECVVTVLDRTKEYLVISVTLLETNKHCHKKTDLITFLVNEWGMNINCNLNDSIASESSSLTENADIVIENSELFCSDDERVKDAVISGSPVVFQHSNSGENKNESCTTIDVENLSWSKAKGGMSASTPYLISIENLLMNYKMVDIPDEIEFIEIELCCSISAFEFYAQLKENVHSTVLQSYYKQYQLLMNELQTEACKQPVIKSLTPHTPCCAQFTDGLWYRCLIIETESIDGTDTVEIKLLFVDYGNDEYRSVDPELHELHSLKKEWMELPAMAIKCKLWNVEVVSLANRNALLSKLESMYNKRVIATVKDVDENFMYVELYEDETRKELMYSALIEEGLFQFKSNKNE